jgi:uroporphyrinogen-III synthase
MDAITSSGGFAEECRCYSLVPTGDALRLHGADAILFTSAQSFKTAIWEPTPDLLIMAIGEITASVMREGGVVPVVVGDGSLEGTLRKLNQFCNGM